MTSSGRPVDMAGSDCKPARVVTTERKGHSLFLFRCPVNVDWRLWWLIGRVEKDSCCGE
jgi:hypothetical protein